MSVNNKVLVTGSEGFIGSHLTEALVNNGFKVKALVQYNSFNSWGWLDHIPKDILSNIEVVTGNIEDDGLMLEIMNGVDIVVHLASLIAIPYSYKSPRSYVNTNVIGTLNVLQAAKANNVSKIIHTSTSEVYGSAEFVPINEKHPLKGQSPYSATKIAADQLALSFYNSFDLPITILRPFNTYGPRQSERAVIPAIINQLNSGVTDIKLGSQFPTRDFSYVSDTVNGFLSCIKTDAGIGEVINLGSNYEVSIKETVQIIGKILKVNVKIIEDKTRIRPEKSEVTRLWSDNSKAFHTLGWQPEFRGIEGFERGLRLTANWFNDPENIDQYKSSRYTI